MVPAILRTVAMCGPTATTVLMAEGLITVPTIVTMAALVLLEIIATAVAQIQAAMVITAVRRVGIIRPGRIPIEVVVVDLRMVQVAELPHPA